MKKILLTHLQNYLQRSGNKRIVVDHDDGKWEIGNCSSCGFKGMFWDGGKRDSHFCIKCNPRVIE